MKTWFCIRNSFLPLPLVVLSFSGVIPAARAVSGEDKMKPEDLIAKHLESIGPVEARAAATSRAITGSAAVTFRQGGRGHAEGKAALLSHGEKNLIAMVFGVLDYPFEKIGFDGQRVTAGQVKPGVRTLLGKFLVTNDFALREGLVGGTLSSAWPLLNVSSRKATLQYDGLKKVEKRPLHALRYGAPKGSDLKVTLFFDPNSFQHVRTEYHQNIGSEVGSNKPGQSVEQEETWIDIVEEFSDFRAENKLMMPHAYKLQFTIRSARGSLLTDWVLNLTQFEFGMSIDEKDFNVESN